MVGFGLLGGAALILSSAMRDSGPYGFSLPCPDRSGRDVTGMRPTDFEAPPSDLLLRGDTPEIDGILPERVLA